MIINCIKFNLNKINAMKQIFLTLSLLFFFTGLKLSAQKDPVAFIVFSNPSEEKNLTLFYNGSPNAEAYTEFTNKAGTGCLFIPSGKYAYFKVDDATIASGESNLIINITYLDEGLGSLTIHYNATNGVNYEKQTVKKTGSNTWITTTIGITNASFRNAQNNQADFRITENNYIRSIYISKGTFHPENEKVPETKGSAYSEFKGKAVAGYQAWFTASATNSGWVHWSANKQPEIGNFSFEVYPDVTEYDAQKLHQTGFARLGNGEPSRLFSSADVIDTHFKWMKETGIDGVAVQRFIGDTPYPVTASNQSILMKIKRAAEENKKIFYICYDMSSGKDENAWVESIKFDWVFNIEQTNELTKSPAYATVNNRPVVQIWGPGFTSRVGNVAGTLKLIDFLKSRGCYVIGGVPTNWRTESGDSKPGFMTAYKAYNMVSPWTPGRYSGTPGCDEYKTNYLVPDKNFCDANKLDYMPVLFPGFAWSTWNNGIPNHIPREAGQFLWRQAYNIKTTGITEMYFAMFDEYDEGTAIMKAATDWSMIPENQYFLTLSADGIWVSPDYYLRVAGEATAMLKSAAAPVGKVAVPHSLGPVYYRNSFEKRFTSWVRNGVKGEGIQNLDPCFYNDYMIAKNNVVSAVCEITEDPGNAKSGRYAVKTSGNSSTPGSANFDYKIAEVSIPVVEKLKLSFWKKTTDEYGKYVFVDLLFESGKRLSQLGSYTDQNSNNMRAETAHGTVGAGFEQFVCEIGKGELIGDKISAILISYKKEGSGSFSAFFDDVLLSTETVSVPTHAQVFSENAPFVFESKGDLHFQNIPLNSDIKIYNASGVPVKFFRLRSPLEPVRLSNGMYIIAAKSENCLFTQKIIITK